MGVVCVVFCRLVARRSRTHHMRRAPVCAVVPCAIRCGILDWCSWLVTLVGGVGAASHMLHTPLPFNCVRGHGRVPRLSTPACGHPYTWAGSTTDAWAGAVDTLAEDHEDTRTPSRLCRTGWIPAPAHTRCAILVTLGVAPAFVKSTPQQQDVRERVQRHAIVVGGDGFEAAAFDP